MTARPTAPAVAAETRRHLALWLDVAATASLIAGTAALVAIVDTRTFGVSRIYVAIIAATAPILGLLYLAGRRMSADPNGSGRSPPPAPPANNRELRRRLARWLVDLAVWFCALNVVLLPGNLLLALNRWLDRSQPVEAAYVVDNKKWLHKDKRAYFLMATGGPALSQQKQVKESVPVSKALYDRIVLDRTKVVLVMHDGAFGFPWMRHRDLRWMDLAPPR